MYPRVVLSPCSSLIEVRESICCSMQPSAVYPLHQGGLNLSNLGQAKQWLIARTTIWIWRHNKTSHRVLSDDDGWYFNKSEIKHISLKSECILSSFCGKTRPRNETKNCKNTGLYLPGIVQYSGYNRRYHWFIILFISHIQNNLRVKSCKHVRISNLEPEEADTAGVVPSTLIYSWSYSCSLG